MQRFWQNRARPFLRWQASCPCTRHTIHTLDLRLLTNPWANIVAFSKNAICRSVREAAAKLQSVLCQKAGKGLAPFLKQLMGPWLLQQHDLHPEVSKSAASGLTAVFPVPKLTNAITFCSSQVSLQSFSPLAWHSSKPLSSLV